MPGKYKKYLAQATGLGVFLTGSTLLSKGWELIFLSGAKRGSDKGA